MRKMYLPYLPFQDPSLSHTLYTILACRTDLGIPVRRNAIYILYEDVHIFH